MRLSKTVDGVEYTYLYEGGLLVQETRGSKIFDYSYDANGNIRMLKYRTGPTGSVMYVYYALNSRGDVIGLYNGSGSLFAKYNYDAWGNIVSITNASGVEVGDSHIAKIQPFRYRSYYYDTDSGFYYLQSRYYDPVTHRFINADGLVSTGTGNLGHNMFAYCDNNPTNYCDSSGSYPTYSGITCDGVKFSHVPTHQLGYYGQIKEYHQDGEIIPKTSSTKKTYIFIVEILNQQAMY